MIVDAARNGVWNQVSPEIMMGSAGPVTLAGALVQPNAEVLAGLVLAQLAYKPGSSFISGCGSVPMGLRNAEISQGGFETALFNTAVVQIADRCGLRGFRRATPSIESPVRERRRRLLWAST